MSGAPERPQRPRQVRFVVAAACVGCLLLLPALFGLGMGRILADVWVSVMGTVINLVRAMFGAA